MRYSTIDRLIGSLLVSALMLALSSGEARAGEIKWRSGASELTPSTAAETATRLVSMTQARGDAGFSHVVIQFSKPISKSERQRLQAGGVTLLNYLGDNAYFATARPRALVERDIASVASLVAVADIERDWKMHPSLIRSELMPWADVNADPSTFEKEGGAAVRVVDANEADRVLAAAYVMFHPDVNLDLAAVDVLQRHGAVIRGTMRSINGYLVELPYSQIALLADEDAVQYIEPPLPRLSAVNDSNRARTGSDVAQAPPYNLDGTGVNVLVYDGGVALATHVDFGGRLTARDSSGLSDHSTHVAGTIGGDGALSAGVNRGMAPGVTIQSYGFETGGPLEAGFLYTNPGDLEADYNEAINVYGVDISNNSIGTNVAPNGFPCSWEGDYNATSALIDAIVRGSLGAPFRIVWAAGNERGNGSCGATYNTIAPPAGAKNHLSIGALNSNDDSVTSFTGWGPTDDGRMKPDFAAPGCQTGGDGGVTSCSSSGNYTTKCGTSMASPTVCGMSALIIEDFRANYPGEPDFRNSTLKAVLAQTAVDIENPGPDYRTGYGSVRVIPAIELMRAGNFLESEVEQDQVVQVLVVVGALDTQLKVTLAWDDVPGTPAVNPVLVNDLDLRVLDANSNAFMPWTLNPAVPGDPAIRTQADHVNNIEQVVIDAPPPGEYFVQITGFNVPQGPQSFSLAAEPLLINCSPQGVIRFDQDAYNCASIAAVSVNDCDLNQNDLAIESINITVVSNTEPGGETITLTETSPQSALFVGTIGLATTDAVGTLHITEGDSITASYLDADDGFGNTNVLVEESVGIDCTAPVVSGVSAINVDPRSATVIFDTDEPALGVVRFGTDCNDLSTEAAASGFVTSHSIDLTELQDDTTYFYGIQATDPAVNTAFDTNGAACYSFTTPEIPDYFTEDFLADFDLTNSAILYAPNGSVDFYSSCTFETLVLPTNPAGGNSVVLSDAGTAEVPLTGGAQIHLYGVSYNTIFINANGNLTFDAGDSDTTETFEDHFDQPRVSLLFDDLDPSEGGSVSYKQLADRFVVTWLNVSEDGANNDNTFQVELYYDGRIQLAWLGVAANDGIVGLSAGLGVPVDFFESDLSNVSDCGPRAPSAAGRTVVVGEGRTADIELLASDDGEPLVPGMLSYIVTSLPVYELRDAGDNHLIAPGDLPYALVGGGNALTYTPTNGFIGIDAFNFKANDGGSPPDAGDSNIATVTIQVDPVLQVPIYDPFPTTEFDLGVWSLVSHATIDEDGINEPSIPYSARLNGSPAGGDELRTHLVDLSGLSDARMVYWFERTGEGESPDSGENLRVDYFDQNGTWQPLREYAGDGDDMTSFQREDVLLPAGALHDSFRARFRTTGTGSQSNIDDWFIDNVSVTIGDAPFANPAVVEVRQDDVTDIALEGLDPNLDVLSYVIVSLPSNGTLSDPNGGVIDSNGLPYTLVGNQNIVRYQRNGLFLGADSFTFKVNDGTYDSFVASITVDVQPLIELPFEDTFPDFVFNPLNWGDILGASIDGTGINEPSPPNAARLNGNSTAGDAITSFPINLEGYTGIRLRYAWERTGGGNSPEAGDDLFVEYFDTNGAWQVLAQHLGDGPDMTDFEVADELLPTESLHGNFQLRFRVSSNSGDDWFVDDVLVYHPDAPTATSQKVLVRRFGWAEMSLMASDPNEDALDFVIYSLPSHGELYDLGDLSLITEESLPYVLVGGGNEVLYAPPLGFEGSDQLTFRANDGALDSTLGTISLQVGGELPVFSFPMDVDPGWATEGLWAFGVPQGIDFDPVSGVTGTNVYGYNLAGKYESNLPPTHLTTTPLDLSIVENAELRFERWLGVESSFFDHAAVELSINGVDWNVIWEHTVVAGIFDRAWVPQTIDIASLADHESAIQIRWVMGSTDGSGEFEGWSIDDVEIFGDVIASLGDIDTDGDVDNADMRAFAACLAGPNSTPTPPAPMAAINCLNAFDFDTDGDVDLTDFAEFAKVFTGPS
ncbi:MAG: S8 family serine peptidase [Phycisphaerae bacterium]